MTEATAGLPVQNGGSAVQNNGSAGATQQGHRRRVTHDRVVDLDEAARGAAIFLAALGVDVQRDGLSDTPVRMARAWAEFFTPREFDLTTFPNDEGYGDLVLARDIPFRSVCEHHLLPFTGTAHVGYLPGERILGLSKLARVVELFASRPQVQERLTQQIANWLEGQLAPRGVGVVLEAEHSCMTMRGVRATGSSTVTSALHGLLPGGRPLAGRVPRLHRRPALTHGRGCPRRRTSAGKRVRSPERRLSPAGRRVVIRCSAGRGRVLRGSLTSRQPFRSDHDGAR